MQRDIVVKGRRLGGSSDLTLLAKIKPGFIESLESVTYKTRIKRVLELLHVARLSSHEHHTARLLSDAVERVGAIHSVRVAVLEPEDKVLLAVTFDGSWEAYIRVLWDKVGSLLDIIFCGTESYVTAADHSFAEWLEWARRVQVETGFFYGPPEATARDVVYQRRLEDMRVRGEASELAELRASAPSVEEATQRLVRLVPPQPDDPQYLITDHVRMVRERIRIGLQGLSGLYRLADLHRPGTPDGDVLRRAALDLLMEFVQMHDSKLIRRQLEDELANKRFVRQIEWLFPALDQPAAIAREVPSPASKRPPIADAIRADVQGGILRSYDGSTHAVVLLLAFDAPVVAAAFLKYALPRINTDRDADYRKPVHWNLAFTAQGLRAAGLCDDELDLFPEEFRQGMAARCGLLGDVRNNHPRRWRLPPGFKDLNKPVDASLSIEFDAVHATLQLRCAFVETGDSDVHSIEDPTHPLRPPIADMLAAVPGLRILAVQSLKRRFEPRVDDQGVTQQAIVEHFGYADGSGQPDLEPQQVAYDRNRVQLGEVVLGQDNAMDFEIDPCDPQLPADTRARQLWLRNGSFLAMRKYRQFVHRFDAVANAAAQDLVKADAALPPDSAREIVYAKLMGRYRDGTPIVAPTQTKPEEQNLFDYEDDKQGSKCPLTAHIRRGHPRMDPAKSGRVPRLMRRSMSYGPKRDPNENGDAVDRGLLFMAYNADLGQQFEVVQRWLTGGNSTGASSGASCPIVGVPPNGLARHFRFEHDKRVHRAQLELDPMLFDEPPVLTRLEWGLYLFAPSLAVLKRVYTAACTAVVNSPRLAVPWSLARGRELLAMLADVQAREGHERAVVAWKIAIEDPESIDRMDSASLWAAIREDHGGALRTPYGVLVADRDLIHDVYLDPKGLYSVCGQFDRMKHSFGEISLGMDMCDEYRDQSEPINTEIGKLAQQGVYDLAFNSATKAIDDIVARAKSQSVEVSDPRFDVGFEAREIAEHVLADLSEAWFGLEDGEFFERGSTNWSWQCGERPLYPGHFTALSRYMFQPNPGEMPTELGQVYGRALREAMRRFVAYKRAHGGFAGHALATAILNNPTYGNDDDFVARNMVGVLMGFNPTIIGAVLNVLREWQRDGSFGALRARMMLDPAHANAQTCLSGPMAAAARMRPMPQLGWRTVRAAHRFVARDGTGIDLAPGDKVVMAMVSGTQQSQADGGDDHRAMFGGNRGLTPHPTHACPGYKAGIGAMLGTLAAILCRSENLRPGAVPLTFSIDGPSGMPPPPVRPATAPAAASSKRASIEEARKLPHRRVGSRGRVLGWGDSWVDYRLPEINLSLGQDLRDCFEKAGYIAPTDFCVWTDWPLIETMANDTAPFCEFLRNELQLRRPNAILLSGGGNDSTEDKLEALIVKKAAGAPPPAKAIDPARLKTHMEGLAEHYRTVLRAIAAVYEQEGVADRPVPVLLHGYDYPIPRGVLRPKWLKVPFMNSGYDMGSTTTADALAARAGMRDVIDEFNHQLSLLPGKFKFATYVDLRGTLDQVARGDPSKFPKVDDVWANDIHPKDEGFAALAAKLQAMVAALSAPTPGNKKTARQPVE